MPGGASTEHDGGGGGVGGTTASRVLLELPGNSPYRQKQLGNGGGYVGGGGGMEGVGGDPGRESKVPGENIHAGLNGGEDSPLAQRRARCVFRVGRPCVSRSVLQGVARVLQSVAGCCRVLQGAAGCVFRVGRPCVRRSVLQDVARVLRGVAVCCRVLQGACFELGLRVFVMMCCWVLCVVCVSLCS